MGEQPIFFFFFSRTAPCWFPLPADHCSTVDFSPLVGLAVGFVFAIATTRKKTFKYPIDPSSARTVPNGTESQVVLSNSFSLPGVQARVVRSSGRPTLHFPSVVTLLNELKPPSICLPFPPPRFETLLPQHYGMRRFY